jgi:ATP-dependent RNA helicase RhlE
MNQGHIHLDQLEAFVLDEADRMLDMGFLPDLKRIISKLPKERQSLFFSATMPPKITELSQQLLRDPVSVNVTPKSTSVERIKQRMLFVERGGKHGMLEQILTAGDVDRALVFTKTKRGANMLAEKLAKNGFRATAIHGNKSQGARQRALEAFRRKQVQILVATDVAARGIDIDGITHVVNYDMPMEPESYVHRIGRTGRAGAAGLALSFCTSGERRELRAIEQLIGKKIPLDAASAPPPQRSAASESPANRRDGTGSRRRSGQYKGPQRQTNHQPAKVSATAGSGESNQSKPRRKPRRKGMQHRQRVNQTT